MVRRISTGSPFEARFGYCRAVIDGERVHVSGTTGYDYRTMQLPAEAGAQARNAIDTIERTLAEAGGRLADVVRVTYYVADRADVPAIADVVGAAFADIRPAATMIIAGLIEEAMKVEIEVEARIGASAS